MFYSAGIYRTSDLVDSISTDAERTALRRLGDEPGYIEVLQQRAGSLNIKRLKEARYPRLKNLSLFCAWEDPGT